MGPSGAYKRASRQPSPSGSPSLDPPLPAAHGCPQPTCRVTRPRTTSSNILAGQRLKVIPDSRAWPRTVRAWGPSEAPHSRAGGGLRQPPGPGGVGGGRGTAAPPHHRQPRIIAYKFCSALSTPEAPCECPASLSHSLTRCSPSGGIWGVLALTPETPRLPPLWTRVGGQMASPLPFSTRGYLPTTPPPWPNPSAGPSAPLGRLEAAHPQPAPFCPNRRNPVPRAALTNPDQPGKQPPSPAPCLPCLPSNRAHALGSAPITPASRSPAPAPGSSLGLRQDACRLHIRQRPRVPMCAHRCKHARMRVCARVCVHARKQVHGRVHV